MTTTGTIEKTERERIITALYAWIAQRPGLEYGNYGNPTTYKQELRSIQRDLQEARVLLRSVELSGVTGDALKDAFRAYSGRLTWDGEKLSYCTGQYWPTEYRKVVCAVAASALWDYHRAEYSADAKEGESAGGAIRRNFRRAYGKRIQTRWFD